MNYEIADEIFIPLFSKIEIETCSLCNRHCSTCLRNNYPDKSKTAGWFEKNFLEDYIIYNIIDQAEKMSFHGELGLQHYNEPLLDDRLIYFAEYAKKKNIFSKISICTNGDFLNNDKVQQLDGVVDEIIISADIFSNIFKKTKIICIGSKHITTHFSKNKNLQQKIQNSKSKSCNLCYQTMYINYAGDMLLCCEDLVGIFDLGNIKTSSLEELWFSEKHQKILIDLKQQNSRKNYQYCLICPR